MLFLRVCVCVCVCSFGWAGVSEWVHECDLTLTFWHFPTRIKEALSWQPKNTLINSSSSSFQNIHDQSEFLLEPLEALFYDC